MQRTGTFTRPAVRGAAIVGLAACLATIAAAQESQDTFFDRADFNSCAAFTDLHADRGAYLSWADGYLTARAEDGGLRRYATRDGNTARFMQWLVAFCHARPQETFYAAVAALDQGLRDGSVR